MQSNVALCYSSKNTTSPINPLDKQANTVFELDNPHLNSAFILAGTPFILRSDASSNDDWRKTRPDLVCGLNQMRALPAQSRRRVALLDEICGSDNLEALAAFYQKELLPILKNQSPGAIGAASTALDKRFSEFADSAKKLQEALIEVREGKQAKLPKRNMMYLEQKVRLLSKAFNQQFQVELNKYIGRVKSKRGTVYTNGERGINVAKSSRAVTPIQFTSNDAFQKVRAFEKGAKFLGNGLIMLDAGIRAGHVHTDYLAGKDWQRRAAVETTGFGLGTFAGLKLGGAVIRAGLGIAMLATPTGWAFLIGTSIATGIIAAKLGDIFGKGAAGFLYDESSSFGWF